MIIRKIYQIVSFPVNILVIGVAVLACIEPLSRSRAPNEEEIIFASIALLLALSSAYFVLRTWSFYRKNKADIDELILDGEVEGRDSRFRFYALSGSLNILGGLILVVFGIIGLTFMNNLNFRDTDDILRLLTVSGLLLYGGLTIYYNATTMTAIHRQRKFERKLDAEDDILDNL